MHITLLFFLLNKCICSLSWKMLRSNLTNSNTLCGLLSPHRAPVCFLFIPSHSAKEGALQRKWICLQLYPTQTVAPVPALFTFIWCVAEPLECTVLLHLIKNGQMFLLMKMLCNWKKTTRNHFWQLLALLTQKTGVLMFPQQAKSVLTTPYWTAGILAKLIHVSIYDALTHKRSLK